MKSITIHNMSEELSSKIDSLSKEMDISKNKLLKRLLSKALGIDKSDHPKIDVSMVASSMTEDEAVNLFQDITVFDEIEATEWQ